MNGSSLPTYLTDLFLKHAAEYFPVFFTRIAVILSGIHASQHEKGRLLWMHFTCQKLQEWS